jgi:hypothetical protein
MEVLRATCSCSVELFELWYALADFLPNWNFRGVFSVNRRKDLRSCDGRRRVYIISFAVYLCTFTLPSMYLNACLQYNKQSKEEKNKKRDMKRRIRREQQEEKKKNVKRIKQKSIRCDHKSYIYINFDPK